MSLKVISTSSMLCWTTEILRRVSFFFQFWYETERRIIIQLLQVIFIFIFDVLTIIWKHKEKNEIKPNKKKICPENSGSISVSKVNYTLDAGVKLSSLFKDLNTIYTNCMSIRCSNEPKYIDNVLTALCIFIYDSIWYKPHTYRLSPFNHISYDIFHITQCNSYKVNFTILYIKFNHIIWILLSFRFNFQHIFLSLFKIIHLNVEEMCACAYFRILCFYFNCWQHGPRTY